MNGQDGSSCGVSDNGDGTKTISCTDGTSAMVSDGATGPVGPQGDTGDAGLACWDLNANGVRDTLEDINADGKWDTADCIGSGADLNQVNDSIDNLSERLDMLELRFADLDADNDGYSPNQGDCNDADRDISPVAAEILGDGIDNDCDGIVDTLADNDGDGYTVEQGDCDNFNPDTYPGAPELPDGLDNDCDGTLADEDRDGDGYSSLDGDCNDSNRFIYPGAPELADGLDNDCDGTIADEDKDGDGYSSLDGDCNDNSSLVHPGQTSFFTTRPSGGGSFDYNCDGESERYLSTVGSCSNATCGNALSGYYDCYSISEIGWIGGVPSCGTSGHWASTTTTLPVSGRCSDLGNNNVQACR